MEPPQLSEVRPFVMGSCSSHGWAIDMAKSKRTRISRQRLLIFAGAAGVVIAGLIFLTAGDPATTGSSETPDITLSFFDGHTEELADMTGEPVVLNFWASWCPACISEMPAFGEVHRQLSDKVRFVGVNMQEVNLEAAIDLVGRTGVEYELAHDPNGQIFNAFGGLAMPTTVFIRADGSVARVHSGAIFSEELTSIIEDELLG